MVKTTNGLYESAREYFSNTDMWREQPQLQYANKLDINNCSEKSANEIYVSQILLLYCM